MKNVHRINEKIYITSDEEIKFNDYITDGQIQSLSCSLSGKKKIIMTTDQDLIKDGVQAIDDTFLEWFVKNPSCEEVEVDNNWNYPLDKSWEYKIIIPKEEQKQRLIDMMKGDEELGLYEEPKQEITFEVLFNGEKRKGVKELIEKQIEKAIRETLVISNPQSIYIAVKKIMLLLDDTKNECKKL